MVAQAVKTVGTVGESLYSMSGNMDRNGRCNSFSRFEIAVLYAYCVLCFRDGLVGRQRNMLVYYKQIFVRRSGSGVGNNMGPGDYALGVPVGIQRHVQQATSPGRGVEKKKR